MTLAVSFVCLALLAGFAVAVSSPARATPGPALPSPSIQPVAAPPVTDAAKMRDQLLRIAREKSTTDAAVAFGVVAAWQRVFPRLHFATSGSSPTTDTVAGGETLRPDRSDSTRRVLTFVVVDTSGRCAAGYMSGAGWLDSYEPAEVSGECADIAIYKARNPDPPPEPEAEPTSGGGTRRRSSSGSGSSAPTSGRGGIQPVPLGSSQVVRPAP